MVPRFPFSPDVETDRVFTKKKETSLTAEQQFVISATYVTHVVQSFFLGLIAQVLCSSHLLPYGADV